jgi:hypothetical protein
VIDVGLRSALKRLIGPACVGTFCDGTLRHRWGRFSFGTLGTFVFGLAALVIFPLTFGNCVSLFGNKSHTFRFEPNRSPAST